MKTLSNKNFTKFNLTKLPVCSNIDLTPELQAELLDVLSEINFNRITVPVGAYIYSITNEKDSTKNINVGYVKTFNKEQFTFDITIHDKFKDQIKKFGSYGAEVICGIKNNHITKIYKINVIDLSDDRYEEETTEDTEVSAAAEEE